MSEIHRPRKPLEEVREAMPFPCQIKGKDGTITDAEITGKKEEFPMVHIPGQGSFGISWTLAARVYFGLAKYIIY